jgi:hypothetical protein
MYNYEFCTCTIIHPSKKLTIGYYNIKNINPKNYFAYDRVCIILTKPEELDFIKNEIIKTVYMEPILVTPSWGMRKEEDYYIDLSNFLHSLGFQPYEETNLYTNWIKPRTR